MPVKESVKNRLRASGIPVDSMQSGKTTRVNDKTIKESKQARREMCLRALRNGDPFPLIRYEWPELIITDPDELRVFKQVCERKDHLDLRFDDFQIEAIRATFDRCHSRLMVSGGTKLGKGLIVGGFIVNLWFEAYPDCKILLVGPSVTHVQDNLYAETRKWRAKMTSYKDGDVTPDLLSEKMWYTDRPEHWVKIVNPDSGEGFSGSHSPHTLIVMDEACLDPETEVLTDSGWKKIPTVCPGDRVLSLNPQTMTAFWEHPSHIRFSRFSGKMVHFKARGVDCLMTPNHRIPVWKENFRNHKRRFSGFVDASAASDLGSHVTTAVCFDMHGNDLSTYSLPEYSVKDKGNVPGTFAMDDWLEFLGWHLSEGCLWMRGETAYSVSISQKKPQNLKQIQQCCDRLGFRYAVYKNGCSGGFQVRISSRRLAEHLREICGRLSASVRVPRFVFELSSRQKRIFLDAFRLGDGYVQRSANVYYTSSKGLADDLQILGMMTGKRCTVKSRGGVGRVSMIEGREVTTKSECFVVTESGPSSIQWAKRSAKEVDYDGMVYCLTMPTHGMFMIRRNGLCMWTGNSDQPDERYRDALSQCASAFFIAISNPRKPSGFFWRAFIGFDQGWKTVVSDAGPTKLVSVGLAHCLNVRARRVAGLVAPSATFPFGPYEIDGEVVPPSSVIPEHLRKHTQLLIPGQGDCVSVATLISECPDDEVQWRVYGKFPDSNKDFMLFQRTFRDIAVAQHAKVAEQIRFRALGIDVASSVAGDYCSLAYGDEKGCKGYRLERNPNLVMLKGWVLGWCRSEFGVTLTDGTYPVGVDPLGLGQGLADMLEMDGVWIIRVGASSAPERNKESYLNRRAEMYGDLSYAVNPKFFGEDDGQRKEPFALPDDEMLWGELFAIEKIYGRDGRKIQLNSKRPVKSLKAQQRTDNRDSIEEKIRRSPDRADSVAFLYQAVMELPEFLGVTMTQYDPSRYLRSYTEICGEVQYTDWKGEEFRVSREEFLLKYGENPPLLPA